MAIIDSIKDKLGQIIYPKTLTKAVYEETTQKRLDTILEDKANKTQVLTDVPTGAIFTDTVYTHPTTSGNKHIPTGGAVGQILKNTASGTATWQNETDTVTPVVDTLTSTSTTSALSANQGKVLNEGLAATNLQLNENIEQILLKANKKQESWINGTLISGWITLGDWGFRYAKNDLNRVTVEFYIRADGNSNIAHGSSIGILPAGYRPTNQVLVNLINNTDGKFEGEAVYINFNGHIELRGLVKPLVINKTYSGTISFYGGA